jgi:arylsulfatase A-like enzyme
MKSAALVLFICSALAGFSATPQRPNIILILSDDMGFSDIGCYGSEIHTPNLDRLAAHGLRFTQFYNTARCCPTRASLLTGLYPHQAGVGHMTEDKGLEGYQGELNNHCVTIAEVLKPAGYRTYAVGKWHVARNTRSEGDKHDWPLQRGFDHYYGTISGAGSYWDPSSLVHDNTMITAFNDPEYHPEVFYYTDAIADHAARFATEHARDHGSEPFFMYVAFTAAHWPLHAKESDIAKYHGVYDQGYGPIRKARFEKEKALGLISKDWELSPQFGDWESVGNKAWEARCMEVYAAQIDALDQGIGRIVAALDRNGQMKNTLLLFLQDNGGCAEPIGRSGHDVRADKPTLPPLSKDFFQYGSEPKQTRDGWPVLHAPVLAGPKDTFMAYGQAWANVSDTPFREYKHWVHEGGISTPLIVHWPARVKTGGELRSQPGHLIDIMATCIELSGAHYPKEFHGQSITPFEGKSLLPALDNQPLHRKAIFWEHEGNRAVRMGKWKLVAKGPAGPWELYDMEADRTELHDLAASNPDRVKEMTAEWEAYAKRAKVLPWIWKPAYGQKESALYSQARHFELGPAADLRGSDVPNLINRPLSIRIDLEQQATDGVLLAQGGSTHGITFYFKNGDLVFGVRRDHNLQTVAAHGAELAHAHSVAATLGSDGTVHLSAEGKEIASGKTAGPIHEMPVDGLQVGRDLAGAVGDYKSPFPFKGKIKSAVLDLQ